MKLTREEAARVANLARLRLTREEEIEFTEQLDKILAYMDQLERLDTSDVEPFSQTPGTTQALRDDKAANRPDPDALLANAPDRDGTFFKVPKILE